MIANQFFAYKCPETPLVVTRSPAASPASLARSAAESPQAPQFSVLNFIRNKLHGLPSILIIRTLSSNTLYRLLDRELIKRLHATRANNRTLTAAAVDGLTKSMKYYITYHKNGIGSAYGENEPKRVVKFSNGCISYSPRGAKLDFYNDHRLSLSHYSECSISPINRDLYQMSGVQKILLNRSTLSGYKQIFHKFAIHSVRHQSCLTHSD
jgi:hypothetical protein